MAREKKKGLLNELGDALSGQEDDIAREALKKKVEEAQDAAETAKKKAAAAERRAKAAEAEVAVLKRQKDALESQVESLERALNAAKASAEAKPRTYVVKSGDSLSKIAKKVLGDANRWKEIYEANRDKIDDPNLIHPGQELRLP